MRTMSIREHGATLVAAVAVLAVGCGSPGAPSGSAPAAPTASTPASSIGPTSPSSPSPAPSEAASSSGNLVVVIDGVSYDCSQMFSPTGNWLVPNSVLQPRFWKFSIQIDF